MDKFGTILFVAELTGMAWALMLARKSRDALVEQMRFGELIQ